VLEVTSLVRPAPYPHLGNVGLRSAMWRPVGISIHERKVVMSVRTLMAAAGGLAIALTAMPRVQLHAQLAPLRQDTKFILEAASSNLLEIRLGQTAQTKATNPAVKQFGQQMVADHSNLENQLTASVSKGGVQFKPGMTKEHEQEVAQLDKMSGADFDRAYMSSMIQHHQQDVATFQSAAQTVGSAEARQIIATSLPVLQQHLTMATQVGGQVGASGGVAVATQPGTVATPQPSAATTQSPQGTGTVTADMAFIRDAASSGQMEVRLGQLAQSKASNAAVKQFGQRMVTDHTRMEDQLNSVVATTGVTLNPTINARHQAVVNRMERVSSSGFDRAYMNAMIQAHQDDVNRFQAETQSAQSVQVRNLATNSLPVLQQHLSLALQVGNQVGADSTNVAGSNQPVGGNGDVRADADFIREVGADNQMQIQLAESARNKAKSSDVRQFAEQVVSDHTRLQNQWNAMASRSGIATSSGLGRHHREKVTQLGKVNGKNYDRAYMTLMIQQYQDEVSYWQKEGRASRSAQVRQLVNSGLPTLEQNLAQAKQIGRKVGVNPDDALRNRKDIAKEKKNEK
jgi:putative membrane protein